VGAQHTDEGCGLLCCQCIATITPLLCNMPGKAKLFSHITGREALLCRIEEIRNTRHFIVYILLKLVIIQAARLATSTHYHDKI